MTDSAALAANKQLVTEFLARCSANDMAGAEALLSDDASWWVCGEAGRLRVAGEKNRSQISRLLGSVKAAIPDGLRMEPLGMTAEDDRVAVEVESFGTLTNGRRFNNHYHFLFRVRDGRISAIREYMDSLHAYDVFQG